MNGNDLREVTHQKAVDYFHGTGEVVTLLVERGAEQRIRVRTSGPGNESMTTLSQTINFQPISLTPKLLLPAEEELSSGQPIVPCCAMIAS